MKFSVSQYLFRMSSSGLEVESNVFGLGLCTVFTGVFGNEHFVRTQKQFGSQNLTLRNLS